MPHDRDGKLLQPGDTVIVQCVVKEVQVGNEYCNVTVETVEPMYPGTYKTGITLNTKQVSKIERIKVEENAQEGN